MRLRCPYCQRATEVPGALEGITVKCNACGRVFVAYSFLEDKRTADRIEIELPCRINGFEGRTIDLSMSGLSAEVPGFRGRPKMSADIRIHMPNRDEPLTARGYVARRPRPAQGFPGWGFQFEEVSDPEFLERFLRVRKNLSHIVGKLKT